GCLSNERRISGRTRRACRTCRELALSSLGSASRSAVPDRRGLFSPAARERQRQEGPRQPLRSFSLYRGFAQCCLPSIGGIFAAALRWPVLSGGIEQDVQLRGHAFRRI